MDKRKVCIIFNPAARGGKANSLHAELKELSGAAPIFAPAEGDSIRELARTVLDQGYDHIIAAGGDGTVNGVINAIGTADVLLSVLPVGTMNVFAYELGIRASQLKKCWETIQQGQPKAVDLVLANQSYFVQLAGVGLDAQIVYDLNLNMKAVIGKFAYYAGGFRQIVRPLPQFDVEISGVCRRCGFVLVSRVRNYGGDLEIARGASLLRTDFEVLAFEGSSSIGYLRYLAGVVLGRVDKLRGCSVWHSTSIRLNSTSDQRILTQIDGELACSLPVRLDIVPEAITLLVPPSYFERERVFLCAVKSSEADPLDGVSPRPLPGPSNEELLVTLCIHLSFFMPPSS